VTQAAWTLAARSTILLAVLLPIAMAPAARAAIPDAKIRQGVDRGGFGGIPGAYAQADFALSDGRALGAYIGFDPNDLYFADYGPGEDTFDEDLVVGGHYMVQLLEGTSDEPSVSLLLGAFANRGGLSPEFGFALSHAFDAKWTGRANLVYGPSWGFEVGYRLGPALEGTFGIGGMGIVGLGLRF